MDDISPVEAPPQAASSPQAVDAAPATGAVETAPEPHAFAYELSGEHPALGTMPHEDVQGAISSGKYALPQGQVKVFSPEGALGEIPAEDAKDAFNSGYTYATLDAIQKHADKEKFDSTAQTIGAVIEGGGRGVIGPGMTAAERAIGIPAEDIKKREEAHPYLAGGAEAAAFAASMYFGVGEARLLAKAGVTAAEMAQAAGVSSKVAIGITKMATEMAVMSSGDVANDYLLNKPVSVAGAASHIGMSTLLGGGIGGTTAIAGKIVDHIVPKMGLSEFFDHIKYKLTGANPVDKLVSEAESAIKIHDGAYAGEVWGTSGLKSQAIAKEMPVLNEKITGQAAELSLKTESAIKKMVEDGLPKRFVNQTQDVLAKFQEVITNPKVDSAAIYEATNNFKNDLRSFVPEKAWGTAAMDPTAEGYPFIQSIKSLGRDVRLSLEDSKIWGNAGTILKDLNGSYSEFAPSMKDFKSKFMYKVGDEAIVSPEKFQTYLKQNDKITTASQRKLIVGNFIDDFDKYQKTIDTIYQKAGIVNPHEIVGLGGLRDSLNQKSPWVKAADAFYERAMSHAGGAAAGAAVGAYAGDKTGLPGAGWAGAALGGLMGEKIISSIIKPLMEGTVNAGAFQQAIKFGESALKGKKSIENAAESVFKSGTYMSIRNIAPTDKQLETLDKHVAALSNNPKGILALSRDLGH